MADFTVIGIIGEAIRELLRANLEAAFPGDFSTSSDAVTLISPKDLTASHRLSLFLYHITENPFMKNQPMTKIGSDQYRYSPLCLNLYYLLIPHVVMETESQKGWDSHSLLGKAMQILYDNTILAGPVLKDLLDGMGYGDFYEKIGEVRIILNSLSLDDLTKIWNSLDTSLKVSVSYEVRVVMIDSQRSKKVTRITKKNMDYYQIKGDS